MAYVLCKELGSVCGCDEQKVCFLMGPVSQTATTKPCGVLWWHCEE